MDRILAKFIFLQPVNEIYVMNKELNGI